MVKKSCWLFVLGVTIISCHNTPVKPPTAGSTIPVENIDPTDEQAARRAKSEAYCQLHKIPVYHNPHAFFTDPAEAVTFRTTDEMIDRLYALCYIGLKSEAMPEKDFYPLGGKWHIMDRLSPKERKYVLAAKPTDQQKSDAMWKYEDMHVLLWALGLVDSLDYPDHQCDVKNDIRLFFSIPESALRQKMRPRSRKEILDQADLILRLDWACVDARMKKQPAPAGLNGDVVYERHYVLNWLITDGGQAWDDVTTDT